MKESFVITDFGGLNANSDQDSGDPRIPIWSKNIDPTAPDGQLRGIKADSDWSSSANWVGKSVATVRNGATTRHVWHTGSNLYYWEETSTPTSIGASTSGVNRPALVSDGRSVYIGLGNGATNYPKWYGYIETRTKHFDTAGFTGGWNLLDSKVSNDANFSFIGSTVTAVDGDLPDGYYQVNMSLLYDGFQESPLFANDVSNTEVVTVSRSGGGTTSITVPLYGPGNTVNKRATHVNIYVRYNASTATVTDDRWTPYRLVDTIRYDSSEWDASGDILTWSFSNAFDGPTYESNADQNEDLTNSSVHYKVACSHQNRMVVGGCYVPGDSEFDYTNYIFFSRPLQYSVFDWSTDYVRLPEEPVALVSHNNMVYAFSEVNAYIINTNGIAPFLENTIEGVGCATDLLPVATDHGLFHASDSQLYHDLRPIGFAVNNPNSEAVYAGGTEANKEIDWEAETKTYPHVAYYAYMDTVIFFPGGSTYAYAYYLPKREWYFWDVDVAPYCTVYLSDGTITYLPQSGSYAKKFLHPDTSTRKTFWWESRKIDFGQPNVHKWVYGCYTRTNGGTWDDGMQIEYDSTTVAENTAVTASKRKNEWVKLLIRNTATSGTFSSANIIYRRHYQPRP